ncbi:MAG: GTPase ObgE [Candidatus Gracilibacteria bacterium]|nr:GTPase ObgE [bacterium]MDZ4217262.1 GTPase ObgE [Candidatus Gracilibacteria bacterium]
MFCDQTILKLHAGIGGNGCVAFRREKFEPRGGPNGGDGGKGGNILLVVNTALNTLTHLDTYKQFTAEKGEMGKGQNKHGRNGVDLSLEVPLGTLVREIMRDNEGQILEKREIADLSSESKTLLVAKGGRGGYGNAHFATSIRQAPKFAELGEEGESIEVELELKLVADIGIIGIPSSGKSTLISVLSNAKPKIAAYPFTTLIPHLGVVQIDKKVTYVVADIPGLIEGAHKGKGLGIQFLKHVQRCRLLVHLIDPTQEDALENFHIINRELEAFSSDLATKKQIVVINKSDAIDKPAIKELQQVLKKAIGRKKRFQLSSKPISAATTEGISELKILLFQELRKNPQSTSSSHQPSTDNLQPTCPERSRGTTDHLTYRPHLDNPKYFAAEKIKEGLYRVSGERIEQIVNMSNFDNREAMMRVRDVLKKMGIVKELKKIGIQDGDRLEIGKHELDFQSDF